MAATSTAFLGLPRRYKRVWKARMAGLWWMEFTVVIQGIVRTKARPPQTRHWPRYRLLSRLRGHVGQWDNLASVEATRFRQLNDEHGGHDRTHPGHGRRR